MPVPPRRAVATSRRVRFVHSTCLAATMLACSIAHASHYTVNGAGGGNYTTIQAAVNVLASAPRDTILVQPGNYSETVAFTGAIPVVRLVGTAGSAATTLQTITVPTGNAPGNTGRRWFFDGFTLAQGVNLGLNGNVAEFRRCVLSGPVTSDAGWPANFFSCDFHARVHLSSYCCGAFTDLHFFAAPLYVTGGATGPVTFRNCTFEGPLDTLVSAHPGSGENPVYFRRCTFQSATYGVVTDVACETSILADSCAFSDMAADAIRKLDTSGAIYCLPTRLNVSNSTFDRCGTAVRWTAGKGTIIRMSRCTVRDCSSDGIVISPGEVTTPLGPSISQLVVERSKGHGLVIDTRSYYQDARFEGGMNMIDCRFSDNGGDGMRVNDALPTIYAFHVFVRNSISERNGGAGFRLEGMNWSVQGNVARQNGAEGFVYRTHSTQWDPDTLAYNTSVANGGDGIRMERTAATGKAVQFVQRNISAQNLGVGLRTTSPHDGSVAYNDSRSNADGDFVNVASPSDSNLSVGPLFCNEVAGDVTLVYGSPAGASGVYGLLGARPEACAAQVGVPPGTANVAFAVHPNPARGTVAFVLPSGGAEARIEVLDLSGRRRWEQRVRADGSTVRWSGDTDQGVLAPGLYWARLTRPGETRLVPLVWLR